MGRVTTRNGEETVARARRLARRRGVTRVLAAAAKQRAARLELLGLLEDLDAEHGAPSATVRAEVARDARRIFRR
jgi:hypothetical protein